MHNRKMYRIREVCEATGLKPSTIYKLIRAQAFPKSVHLTARSTGWPSDVVENWVAEKIEGSK